MTDGLPPALRPPVSLALAKAVESVPAEGALTGGCLYEPKWDGYFGLVTAHGATVAEEDVADVLRESLSRIEATVGNLDRLMTKEAQRTAFGDPGEPGDPDFIKHLASRSH